MGNQRVSVRTLSDGYRVRHHPPSKAHPDGHETLIHDHSPLRERLSANLDDNKRRHEALKAKHTERIQVKRDAQDEKGLPPEKSCC